MMPRFDERAHWVLTTLAALGVSAVGAVLITLPAAITFHDDGVYTATAQALAEGRGYRIVSLPSEPLQTKYPVLFPWLLSLVWRLTADFPLNVVWLRCVPAAAAAVWLALSWRMLLDLGATKQGARIFVLLFAAAPWTLYLATSLLSETLFAALLTGATVIVTASLRTPSAWHLAALAGTLSGGACLTRAAGVALAAAGFGTYVFRKRRLDAAAFFGAALVVGGPWALWLATKGAEVPESLGFYSATNYARWNIVAAYAWDEKARVLTVNALLGALAPQNWFGLHLPAWVALPLGTAFVVSAGQGWWRQRRHPAAAVLACTVGLTLLWVWPPLRLLGPVMPLLMWFAWSGTVGWPKAARYGIAMALVVVASASSIQMVATARQRGAACPVPDLAEDWRKMEPLLAWVRAHTLPNAVLAGNLDPAYYLHTNRKAVRAFDTDPYLLFYAPEIMQRQALGTWQDLVARLSRSEVGYLVVTPSRAFEEGAHFNALVEQTLTNRPDLLTLVAGSAASGYALYSVDRSRLR